MYPIFDVVSGHYMSDVKDFGIWVVAYKHRVRGGWKKQERVNGRIYRERNTRQ